MTTSTLLTPQEVASALRVPLGTVLYLVRSGELTAIELPGRHTRIEEAALCKFLDRCREQRP